MALTIDTSMSLFANNAATSATTDVDTKKLTAKEKEDIAFSYAKEEDNETLGKDTFLTLMISKLSNQDPLNPTDDSEFLSQLAQYTTMEQMMNMSEAITLQQGFDMVGKNVIVSHGGKYYTGTVDSVIYDKGEITLDVGGVLVSMDAVKEVLATEYSAGIGNGDTTTGGTEGSTGSGDATTGGAEGSAGSGDATTGGAEGSAGSSDTTTEGDNTEEPVEGTTGDSSITE